MPDIPDAPWVREAELYGGDAPEDYWCPICGEENPEHFYLDSHGDLLGCDGCVKRVDGYDYYCDRLKESQEWRPGT